MLRPVVLFRLAGLLAISTSAFALAACSGTVDQDALESSMVEVANRTADVESASCPDDVSSEEGTDFDCTVINSKGQEVPVTATIISEGDDDVQFEVQTVDGVDITR